MTRNLFIASMMLIYCSFSSCNSDTNAEQFTESELILIKNSPWTFKSYELIEITNNFDSEMTIEDLENTVNQYSDRSLISFMENGELITCIDNVKNTIKTHWEFIDEDMIQLTNCELCLPQISILENISVSENHFSYESKAVSIDSLKEVSVRHFGLFSYQSQ